MGLMGLEAIHPGPRTTVHNPDHKVYPDLLRGVKIERRAETARNQTKPTHGFEDELTKPKEQEKAYKDAMEQNRQIWIALRRRTLG